MPYKLVPPKPGRSKNWRIRGTEFGIPLDRSAKTGDRRVAAKLLAQWREQAQRDALSGPPKPKPLTFALAVIAYMKAGGEKRFLAPLLRHFGEIELTEIDQAAIDGAAVALYPDASPATRNRQVYAPVSVILRRSGVLIPLRRPAGSAPKGRVVWLRPEEAFRLLDAATEANPRFGALLTFLLYCGPRLSDGLKLTWADVDLAGATATLRDTKNGADIPVHMAPVVVAALANLKGRKGKVFNLTKSGRLYHLWAAAEKAAGLALPERSAFHVLRHTYATWRRKYAAGDTAGLVGTGLWKSKTAAAIYEHVEASEESRRSDLLPTQTRAKSV